MVINMVLFMVIYILFSYKRKETSTFFKGIVILSAIEGFICILQHVGWLKSQNRFFEVTGSWQNPNVTAMFIAMVLPSVFGFINPRKRNEHITSIIFIILSVSALIFLKCRSAIIGALVSALVYHWSYIMQYKRKLLDSTKKIGILLVTMGLLSLTAYFFYKQKEASADSRLLIWELSLKMFGEKPLFGYGYGKFEKYYNLVQSQHFGNGLGNDREKANANHVNMAYNEFIQNAVEGGLIGVFLFTLFLATLLISARNHAIRLQNENDTRDLKVEHGDGGFGFRNLRRASYAGIVCFIIMSFTNFTIDGIPVISVMLVYSAFLSVNTSFVSFRQIIPYFRKRQQSEQIAISQRCMSREVQFLSSPMLICFILGSAVLGLNILSKSIADVKNRNAGVLFKQGRTEKAKDILESIGSELSEYKYYWENIGNIYFKEKDYVSALDKYILGLEQCSDPAMLIKAGNCFEKLGNTTAAINYYTMAKNMEPGKLAPKYMLMIVHYEYKQYEEAKKEAKALLNSELKVKSKKAIKYRRKAKRILAELESLI
jgi:O-antigen ligase